MINSSCREIVITNKLIQHEQISACSRNRELFRKRFGSFMRIYFQYDNYRYEMRLFKERGVIGYDLCLKVAIQYEYKDKTERSF